MADRSLKRRPGESYFDLVVHEYVCGRDEHKVEENISNAIYGAPAPETVVSDTGIRSRPERKGFIFENAAPRNLHEKMAECRVFGSLDFLRHVKNFDLFKQSGMPRKPIIMSITPSRHELIESYEASQVLEYDIGVFKEKTLHHEDVKGE